MKKSMLALILTLAMVFSMAAPAAAAASTPAAGTTAAATAAGLFDPAKKQTQVEVLAALLKYAGYKEAQLGVYPADYESLADSLGLLKGLVYDAKAVATQADFDLMLANVKPVYDAMHAKEQAPLFVDGMAQPIFDYDETLRFFVYVETNHDTDGDGKLDLVKTLVQLPKAVLTGMKVATIYEARPYITGCIANDLMEYGTEGYDTASMYATPKARVPAKTAVTTEAAAKATKQSDYLYFNPYDGGEWEYENLTWYDYYLTRGFAMVTTGGLGTMGSEGFETCGTDLEIDAFQCVIEWLNGDTDRVAYSDKTNNKPIVADWSNKNIGMTGRSYSGTTQFGLATTGVEGLKTVVPVAGIASWYSYYNSQGISTEFDLNQNEALAWYCNGRYIDKKDWASIKKDYNNYLNQERMDQIALNGDYGTYWESRDYTLDWAGIKIPALIVHGLNDENVKTEEFDQMYNAFKKANQTETKLLLHQGTHLTPTKHFLLPTEDPKTLPNVKEQTGKEMYIGDQLYDQLLNKWFSHYLYNVQNDVEQMATVTAQSNLDGSWKSYDTWNDGVATATLKANAGLPATTTISSDLDASKTNNDVDKDGNVTTSWKDKVIPAATASTTLYTMPVTKDMTINGPIAVHIKASTDSKDDALMMGAMLVDKNAAPFKAFVTEDGYYLPTNILEENGVWLGGGLQNFDLFEYGQTEVPYKVIAQGWMDLNNPNAGYEINSAVKDETYVAGEMHDYTLYLTPNLYTVAAGHELALVIFTTDPDRNEVKTNYNVTIDNAATYASIPVTELPVRENPFTDVPTGAFFYDAVLWAAENNITSGTTATTFAATSSCTRAQVVTFLWRAMGSPEPTSTTSAFTDVTDSANYAYKAILWAAELGITSGKTATTFEPKETVTRDQFVTFLWRSAGKPVATKDSAFTDVSADSFSVEAVRWAAEKGITAGTTETTFGPKDACERGQVATFLFRHLGAK